ncbi:MAG: c-type cytochrome [Opitutaceae bacterium]
MMISLRLTIIWVVLLGTASTAGAATPAVPASKPDPVNGAKIFALCAACHEPGKAPQSGPELRGVIGRRSATVPGFRYSRAMRRANLTWDESTLDAYLADPQAVVPGNTMPFPGLPVAEERRELIHYLKTLQ